jgi:hypothetical protein
MRIDNGSSVDAARKDSGHRLSRAGVIATYNWTLLTTQATAPANAANADITLYLRPQSVGSAGFDDVTFTINASNARNFVFEK